MQRPLNTQAIQKRRTQTVGVVRRRIIVIIVLLIIIIKIVKTTATANVAATVVTTAIHPKHSPGNTGPQRNAHDDQSRKTERKRHKLQKYERNSINKYKIQEKFKYFRLKAHRWGRFVNTEAHKQNGSMKRDTINITNKSNWNGMAYSPKSK